MGILKVCVGFLYFGVQVQKKCMRRASLLAAAATCAFLNPPRDSRAIRPVPSPHHNSIDAAALLHVKGLPSVLVIDSFVKDQGLFEQARQELLKRVEHSGAFQPTVQHASIRTDQVLWLPLPTAPTCAPTATPDSAQQQPSQGTTALTHVLWEMATLPSHLCMDASNGPETCTRAEPGMTAAQARLHAPRFAQATVYRGSGARYNTHRDNKPLSTRNIEDHALWLSDPEQRDRHLTCILYLTPHDWTTADGGALKCYLGCDDNDDSGATATSTRQIEPLPNRLVVFRSSEVPHEVLPTHRDGRVALTVWLLLKRDFTDSVSKAGH